MEAAVSPLVKQQIQNIIKHKDTRRSWRAINKARGKINQQGISAVDVKKYGDWEKVELREEVEDAIMDNDSKRFHLTDTTPLMSSYMTQKLGFLADTSFAQSVVDGTFVEDSMLDEYTNKFLLAIVCRSTLPTFSAGVEKSNFQGYWKGSRERTSSSMSRRHFGHYKAAAINDLLSDIHSSLLHVASRNGVFLTRWIKGLSVMLEKLKRNIKVNKLRAILLMEADFNSLNKLIFGHRMIQQCEANNRFPDEIYGSRSGISESEVIVNCRVVLEKIKVLQHCGTIAGVDAAQCYDRIVHSLSSLVCQNEGSPISFLIVMYGTVQSMVYYLRTTFGNSTKSYGGKETIPF